MKRSLFSSYVAGITDIIHGEKYSKILKIFIPEYITNLILYVMLFWLDASFIGQLESTAIYATLGVTNNFLHLIVKIAEAVSVGTVILSGKFNGKNEHKQVGRTVRDSFWVTSIVGLFFFVSLYSGAHLIYSSYGLSDDVIALGIPFLRLRAMGILLMFIYFALVGFLRGIKNTKTPMKIFLAGAVVFAFFDYVLIFGKYGFPKMGLQGSALATVLQYAIMLIIALWYVFFDKKNRKYGIELFSVFKDVSYVKELICLSWPVVLDKSLMAFSYIWLGKMIAPMGTCGIAAFCVVKDMERFAIIPAVAFANIITILVSNDFGKENWDGIKSNIKKIIFMTSIMVFSILIFFVFWRDEIIYLFDKKGEFTKLAARAFPILSVLSFFDLLQVVLSGAMRGASNVRTVMMVRFLVCFCYFVPFSYFISQLTIEDQVLKFVLVFGVFYVGNALMSIIYINRFRGENWKLCPLKQ